MPRDYDDEDDRDDRPRKRRRDDDDEDDDDRPRRRRREEPKSNTGLILGIVGGVVLLVLAGCGYGIWKITQGVNQVVQQAKQMGESFEVEAKSEGVADQFLTHLTTGQAQTAYDATTPAFKTKYTKAQFDDLLKKNPLLTKHKDHEEVGTSSVTGDKPNRQRKMQLSLSPTEIDHGFDDFDDEDNPRPPKKPKPPAGPRLTITLTVVETADGQWKVDALTMP